MSGEEQLKYLQNIPKYEQRSPEWFEERKNKLTSSDGATALGINPYKKVTELVLEKSGLGKPFYSNEATLHGQKYEDEAIKKYEIIMGKVVHPFGLINFADLNSWRERKAQRKYIDPRYNFLSGSVDGISIDKVPDPESKLGQVEVKCPLRRKIKHGEIPDYYFPQVQLNMFILDLEFTDFIEYVPPAHGKMELNIVRVYRDEEWFDKNFPTLENFWNQVLDWRTRDITKHPDYNKYSFNKKENLPPPPPVSLFIDDPDDVKPGGIPEECLFSDDENS